MQQAEIVQQVNQLMIEGFEIPPDKLNASANLFSDLGLDSLDAVDMLVHLEEKMNAKIDGEKIKQIRTLQDVYNLVEEVASDNKM